MSSKRNGKGGIAVAVRGVCKEYHLSRLAPKPATLAEALLARMRRPFQGEKKETFFALKNVDFEIQKGDVVGVIGRNGAGKSTLLKILSRITEPTSGEIDLYGRVGSLLEVGTGFHPELSGRENIYLNGAILGMEKAEIRKQFDAIVDFAGVEKFLDTPVKRYSSGMYVRLAFAVAAHLQTEILIIDEVLAVGDAEFQKKCLGKMQQVSTDGGRTVIFVSHNMAAIQHLCHKAVVMERGESYGPCTVEEAIRRYSGATGRGEWSSQVNPGEERKPSVRSAQIIQNGRATDTIGIARPFAVQFQLNDAGLSDEALMAVQITDASGVVIYHSMDCFSAEGRGALRRGHRAMEIPSYGLAAGTYKLSYWLGHPDQGIWDQGCDILAWDVQADCPLMARFSTTGWKGAVGPGLAKWAEEAAA